MFHILVYIFFIFLVNWCIDREEKYNLHSAKSDGVQIPIQLQLSEDNEFLKNLLEVNSPGHARQASDQNSNYHVGLNAVLRLPHPRQRLRKKDSAC